MHRNTSHYLRTRSGDKAYFFFEQAIWAVNAEWTFDVKDSSSWGDCSAQANMHLHIEALSSHKELIEHISASSAQTLVNLLLKAALYQMHVLSQFEEAELLLERALEIQPSKTDRNTKALIFLLLGSASRLLGKFEKARQKLEAVMNLKGEEDAEALFELGKKRIQRCRTHTTYAHTYIHIHNTHRGFVDSPKGIRQSKSFLGTFPQGRWWWNEKKCDSVPTSRRGNKRKALQCG